MRRFDDEPIGAGIDAGVFDLELAGSDGVANRRARHELFDPAYALVHERGQRGEVLSQLGIGRRGLLQRSRYAS